MEKLKKIISMFLMFVMLAGLSNVFGAKQNIMIDGSTTVLPIAQYCAEEYMAKNGNVNITVKGGGSGVGITSLIEKTCNIADSSRSMKQQEIKKAISKNVEPVAHIVAMDGIAVIVNKSNPLKNLTKKDLINIYTGKVKFWSQIEGYEGENKVIVVISRDTASGTYESFSELALNKQKVRKDALTNASNKAIASVVQTTPGAIGYVGLGYLNENIKAVTVEGIECNATNVLRAKYPLARPLFMYTNGKPTGAVKDFIDYVLSKEGQDLVQESGFVKIK
jgi:phosphate transport system substrate-binding protein